MINTRLFFLTILLILTNTIILLAQPKVIAHRGFWTYTNAPHNSIEALKNSIENRIWGNEFDVLMTSDGKLIVNHDNKIDGLVISETPYRKLKKKKLSNGEKIPLLKEYLAVCKKVSTTRLILELKPLPNKDSEQKMVKGVVAMVHNMNMEDKVEYISFSLNMCKELHKLNPKAKISFLDGYLSPEKIKEIGLSGLDYHYKVFEKNPQWIDEAHKLGLTVNVWTVNDERIMKNVVKKNFDFITTDYPDKLQNIIESCK